MAQKEPLAEAKEAAEEKLAEAPLETEAAETPEETLEEAPEAEIAAEEAKPTKREAEEEIVEERFYTIPLAKAFAGPPNKRAPRAIRIIKRFVTRHMKLEMPVSEEEEEEVGRLLIASEVNEKVWSRGVEKPPRKIRVRAAKDKEGRVTVYLAE
jgi:large subunit ribosomal protein L31e